MAQAWKEDGWERAVAAERRIDTFQTLTFFMVGGAIMLFTCFTASYLVRRESADWVKLALPPILWVNTALIVLSSLTLEAARFVKPAASRRWVGVTIALGVLFVVGQVLAWRELVRKGVFATTDPHASFFYMLTGVHAVHIAAGIAVLAYAFRRAGRAPLGLCAAWWHVVGAAWVWVAVLISVL